MQGNYIGTDVTGMVAMGNSGPGVVIFNSNRNTIGAEASGARNVISSNNGAGIVLYGGTTNDPGPQGAQENKIQGNFIGTNAAGTAQLGNNGDGIQITINVGGANNTVGGPQLGMRNIISGNNGNGISIGIRLPPLIGADGKPLSTPGTGGTGITVQNNYIGTDVSGQNCIGNTLDGIFVDADSTTNTISDNLIACNGRNGVFIPQNNNPGVRIFLDDNFVYHNAALGIDLGAAGITPNDPLDTDGGANLQQNFPVLNSFGSPSASGGFAGGKEWFDLNGREIPLRLDTTFTVNSQLNSTPNTTFTIHWYFSADSQCVTNQQGSRPLAFGKVPGVTTNGNGDATFSFPFEFPPGITRGIINTTATDPNGNTSEFSACLAVNAPPSIQFSAANYNVNEGGGSATVTVTRSGDTSGASTVDFATSDGSATQNSDYIVASGTLSFAATETSKAFNVLIVDDAYVEANETINLTLSNATGATLSAPTTATITISDNDTANSTSPAPKRLACSLNGAQETPPNNSTAKGIGLVLLNQSETSAVVGLLFQNLGSAETAAHIHGNGGPGVMAPILFPLPTTNPVINFTINPTVQQVADLKAGLHYQNVHSANFANGEIRGQLGWNPTLEENFLIRQQYLDFLSRDGDPGGYNFWVGTITPCQADAQCFHDRTIAAADAFFFEPEFQQTAGFVFRAYRAAYGNTQPFPNPDNTNPAEANKLVDYSVYVADRARVVGGANLAAAQQAFANLFVSRAEFTNRYSAGLTAAQFVDAMLATMQTADGINLTAQRQALIDQYNNAGSGNAGRGMVLYRLADDNVQSNPINNRAFIDAEYNRQFALTLYFGYLRRNPDIGGFLFWQSQINSAPIRDVPKQNALVCSFVTAAEYQLRFGPNAPRTNDECPH